CAEDRAAAAVDRLDRVNGQLAELGPSGLHQGFKAVEKADHLGAVVDRFDRHRADNAVDAGSRSAADEQGQFAATGKIRHGNTLAAHLRRRDLGRACATRPGEATPAWDASPANAAAVLIASRARRVEGSAAASWFGIS